MAHKGVISIDIGSCKTKIVVGSFEKSSLHIEKAFLIDTPKGNLNDGRLLKAEPNASDIGKEIVRAVSLHKIKYKDVIFTIQSTSIIRRELEIPKVKPQEMESLIRYEIEQYLPIDLNEYIIEHKVLEEKQDSKSRILIAALPKEIAEDYINLANSMNLEPHVLDINSNSVSKLFGFKQHINQEAYDLNQTAAFIDLGCRSINISIVSKGYFQFSRLIPTGSFELNEAIADIFSISVEEAEEKKKSEVDLSVHKEGFEAVEGIITRWTDDIQRVFQYYKSRNASNVIDKIYLYGGTSNLKGIASFIERIIGIPTYKLDGLDSIVTDRRNLDAGVEYFINSFGAIIRK